MNITNLLFGEKLKFVDKRHIKNDVYTFRFSAPETFKFIAGQHGIFTIPGITALKAFSIASAPEDEYVMIGTHVHSYSKFKQALNKFQPGDRIKFRGPIMNFTLRGAGKDVVFLAQGIGITPFRSILRHISIAKLETKTTLIHVEAKDHIFREDTSKLATNASYPTNKEDFLNQLQKVIQDKPEANYYISGARSFIQSTTAFLKKSGIPQNKIRVDQFLGY